MAATPPETRFSFRIPDDYLALREARLVMVPRSAISENLTLQLSLTQAGAAHDQLRLQRTVPVTAVGTELVEIPVSNIFADAGPVAGDYASLLVTGSPTLTAVMVGLRFNFESSPAELEAAIQAHENDPGAHPAYARLNGDNTFLGDQHVHGSLGIGPDLADAPLDVVGGDPTNVIQFGTFLNQARLGAGSDRISVSDRDGNERLVIQQSTGRVGIGTTSPSAALDVAGNVEADSVRFPDGSVQTSAGLSALFVSRVERVELMGGNASATRTVHCPAGSPVIAGGWEQQILQSPLPQVPTSGAYAFQSFPSADRQSWTLSIRNDQTFFLRVTFYALCLTVQ